MIDVQEDVKKEKVEMVEEDKSEEVVPMRTEQER